MEKIIIKYDSFGGLHKIYYGYIQARLNLNNIIIEFKKSNEQTYDIEYINKYKCSYIFTSCNDLIKFISKK